MALDIVQICTVKYPGQLEAGNITFRLTDSGLVIASWNVSGIAQPLESDLLAQSDHYEPIYNLFVFNALGKQLIQNTVDNTAQSQQYANGVSCASYVESTNPVWAAQAKAFIAWRDSMYIYALQIQSNIQQGQPPPTQEEFVSGFPVMVWPS